MSAGQTSPIIQYCDNRIDTNDTIIIPLKREFSCNLDSNILLGWSAAFLTSDDFVRSNEIIRM